MIHGLDYIDPLLFISGLSIGLFLGYLLARSRYRSGIDLYSLEIIGFLARTGKPMSLSMISKNLKIPKPVVVSVLKMLRDKGLIEESIGPGAGKLYRFRFESEN